MADCYRCGQHIHGGLETADRETWGHEVRYAHRKCPPKLEPKLEPGSIVNYAALDGPEVVERPNREVKDATQADADSASLEELEAAAEILDEKIKEAKRNAPCDCGGSGWIPGVPDDEPCPKHAVKDEIAVTFDSEAYYWLLQLLFDLAPLDVMQKLVDDGIMSDYDRDKDGNIDWTSHHPYATWVQESSRWDSHENCGVAVEGIIAQLLNKKGGKS
jgi:hypothetical protein